MKTKKNDKNTDHYIDKAHYDTLFNEERIINDLENQLNTTHSRMKKTRHISIRISEVDLLRIKAKAIKTGIPYQSLIGSVLHLYASDKIKLEI